MYLKIEGIERKLMWGFQTITSSIAAVPDIKPMNTVTSFKEDNSFIHQLIDFTDCDVEIKTKPS